MILTTESALVQAVTTATPNVDVNANWADVTATTFTAGNTNTKISSAATTTIVGSPAASTQRQIKSITVRNIHASDPNTVSILHTDGTTSTMVYKITLAAGESAEYDGQVWQSYNSSGQPTNATTTGGVTVADLGGGAETVGGAASNGTAATASRSDHVHAITNPKIDDLATPDDNTDLNASTSAHGLVVKATAPAAGLYNYVGITNAETAYTNKALFDATDPSTQAFGDAAAVGTAAVAARRDHKHAMPATPAAPKLDDNAAPDDNTDLNATTSAHGLAPKAVAPAANELNVLGIANGETTYANKDLFNTTNPADLGVAAAGTAIQASRSDHVHAAPTTVLGNAGTVTVGDAGADPTCFPLVVTSSTGSLSPSTDADQLTYNAQTGSLSALGLVATGAGGSADSPLSVTQTEDSLTVDVVKLQSDSATDGYANTARMRLYMSNAAGTQFEVGQLEWGIPTKTAGSEIGYAALRGIASASSGVLKIQDYEVRVLATNIRPETNDGSALGSASYQWSDLFLAEGAVINFDNGDVTITQAGNTLTITGGSTVVDSIELGHASDTTLARVSAGVVSIEGNNILVSGGALGTPSGGTVTNLTGTASININGTVGATTPAAGTFTTVAASTAANPLTLTNSSDTAAAQVAILQGDSATPADNDEAYISLKLSDDAGNQDEQARITWIAKTVANGATQDGSIAFSVLDNNSLTAMLQLDGALQAANFYYKVVSTGTIQSNIGFIPDANDGAYLGTSALGFSDLFLAEGGVINWDNGDLTLTQAGNKLTIDGGDLTLAENVGIELDAALSADGKYSGIVEAGTAGAALAFGDLCYLAAADSRWELADADAEATAGPVKLGICVLAAAGDGSATTMLLYGKVRADAVFPTLTVSAPAYVGTTAGDIQVVAPSGAADIIRIVGHGNTGDELYFHPSSDWFEHA